MKTRRKLNPQQQFERWLNLLVFLGGEFPGVSRLLQCDLSNSDLSLMAEKMLPKVGFGVSSPRGECGFIYSSKESLSKTVQAFRDWSILPVGYSISGSTLLLSLKEDSFLSSRWVGVGYEYWTRFPDLGVDSEWIEFGGDELLRLMYEEGYEGDLFCLEEASESDIC